MFVPGTIYNRRRDIHDVYGGQRQGGISTPSGHSLIFLFTGDSGKAHGYRDEFRPDGTFWYTGEGQTGDMQLLRGNAAIANHQIDGKTIHLFEALKGAFVMSGKLGTLAIMTNSDLIPTAVRARRSCSSSRLGPLAPPRMPVLRPMRLLLPSGTCGHGR